MIENHVDHASNERTFLSHGPDMFPKGARSNMTKARPERMPD